MSKLIKRFIGIFLVIISVCGALYFTNKTFFKNVLNGIENSYKVSVDDIMFKNWTKQEDGTYMSDVDSQIIFNTKKSEIKNIILLGELSEKELFPKVYFTEEKDVFSEDKAKDVEIKGVKNGYSLEINLKDIDQIRLDLTDDTGLNMNIKSVMVQSEVFNLDLLALVITFMLSIIFATIIQMPLEHYKKIPLYLEGLKKYTFLLQNLVKKDIVTKYRRSVLGILWSVLNPLLMMLVITAVFQNIFKSQIENFPIYYLTGSIMFNFNSEATTATMGSMLEAGPLIKKVYIPKYIFPLEKCFFSLVNFMFSLIAVIFICLVLRFKPPTTIFLALIPVAYLFVFSLGFGMILATLNVFFRDISHLYSVWITAWMYLTPIIYPADILPPWMMTVMKLNPLYYYVEYFRNVVMYGVVPDLRYNLVCIFFSISFLFAGIIIFKRNQDKFILYI